MPLPGGSFRIVDPVTLKILPTELHPPISTRAVTAKALHRVARGSVFLTANPSFKCALIPSAAAAQADRTSFPHVKLSAIHLSIFIE